LAKPIANTLDPLAIINIHFSCAVFLGAERAMTVVLIVSELSIISHLAGSIEVEAASVPLALPQTPFVKISRLVIYRHFHFFF